MQVNPLLTTPRMKLAEGEEVIRKEDAFRRKGAFGNLYGQLYVTNQRVAFVKAIMKSGLISFFANKLGAKPKVAFPLEAIQRVESSEHKGGLRLLVADEKREETFQVDDIDELVALIDSARSAGAAPPVEPGT